MRFRMMSARCCCGTGPTPGCDPVTGATDSFQSLDTSKWVIEKAIGTTVDINPIGTLRYLGDTPGIAVFQARRCAIFDVLWNSPPSLARADNARWNIVGSYELWPNVVLFDDAHITGVSVFGSFPNASGIKTYALTHNLHFIVGTGWIQRITLEEPGLALPFAIDLPGVVQTNKVPYPTGPFSIDLDLLIDRRRIGTQAGTWTSTAWFGATTLFSTRDIATPTCDQTNFDHGFGISPAEGVIKEVKIDSWGYFA